VSPRRKWPDNVRSSARDFKVAEDDRWRCRIGIPADEPSTQLARIFHAFVRFTSKNG